MKIMMTWIWSFEFIIEDICLLKLELWSQHSVYKMCACPQRSPHKTHTHTHHIPLYIIFLIKIFHQFLFTTAAIYFVPNFIFPIIYIHTYVYIVYTYIYILTIIWLYHKLKYLIEGNIKSSKIINYRVKKLLINSNFCKFILIHMVFIITSIYI